MSQNIGVSYETLASFAFLCSYGDGTTDEEIECDLLTGIYQRKGTLPFERSFGGGISKNEQLALNNDSRDLVVKKQIVETIYMINEKRNFDRTIIVGFPDIEVKKDLNKSSYTVNWRRLDDMTQNGGLSFYE